MQTVTLDYCRATQVSGNGTSYKSICPKCSGNDFYVTELNGMAHCFHCGYTAFFGSASHDREHIVFDVGKIRHFYNTIGNHYHSSLRNEDVEYLTDRGISKESILRNRIGYCDSNYNTLYDNPVAQQAGLVSSKKPTLGGRIVFPYLIDNQIVDIRGRSVDGRDPKYKGPFNSSVARGATYPYNYTNAMEMATEYVVITEGEIKALVAQEYGIPTIAVPGISTWRPSISFYSNLKYVVIFDNESNPKTQLAVHKAIVKLSSIVPNLYVVLLPLMGRNKMDLDTYLLMGYNEGLLKRIDTAMSYDFYRNLKKF